MKTYFKKSSKKKKTIISHNKIPETVLKMNKSIDKPIEPESQDVTQ